MPERKVPSQNHLESLASAGVITIHESDTIVGIHLLPDDFPLQQPLIVFIQPKQRFHLDKDTIIFAGIPDQDEIGHEALLEIALNEEVIYDESTLGGGILIQSNTQYLRQSHAFGPIEKNILSDLQDLIQNIK